MADRAVVSTQAPGGGTPFLTARWEHLLLLNFDCPGELLEPLVPAGTELDPWQGTHVISLVGFRFVDTRLRGVPIPWHRTFEEVNLRFYVRRQVPGGPDRRAVVFIKELVPRAAIAWVARRLYNEPYSTVAMAHHVSVSPEAGGTLEYTWSHGGATHSISAEVSGPAPLLEDGSEAEFVTEHYWGCTRQRDGGTLEYQVDHPRWRVWVASQARYGSPAGSTLYPPAFTEVLRRAPRSAFVALGSEVVVYDGVAVA